MIVVDASALVEVLLRTQAASVVEHRLFDAGMTLHAPHLLDAEVAHALRRYAIDGQISGDHGRLALAILADFPLHRHPHHLLLPRVWGLRHNLSAYDAVYVALAEVLRATLVTCDRRLAAAGGHHARIDLM